MNKASGHIETTLETQSSSDSDERLFAALEMLFEHSDQETLDEE